MKYFILSIRAGTFRALALSMGLFLVGGAFSLLFPVGTIKSSITTIPGSFGPGHQSGEGGFTKQIREPNGL
jgi:hypothetical protein